MTPTDLILWSHAAIAAATSVVCVLFSTHIVIALIAGLVDGDVEIFGGRDE